ncbi:succinate dehydrogenase, cytochrome b556 subunit [Thiomicrorhabdus sp.]|uniref:succinate dehydrogenase, cytochrome b556 subunit n=1 Tax=Thiomicrorhabdus sp. TaxID=2039724 RepID=UPI003568CE12
MYQHPGKRPIYLSLWKFHFPLNAWLSAGHRISGMLLFISLLGYLALFNLIILNDNVTLESIRDHCFIRCLNSIFWTSLSYHWLTGLRHLLAEHFTRADAYQKINSHSVSLLLLSLWALLSVFIFIQAWS